MFIFLFAPMLLGPLSGAAMPGNIYSIEIATVALMSIWGAWLWAIASTANDKVDLALRKSPKWMAIGWFYALAYIVGALAFLPYTPTVPGFVVPMHLLAMFAIFYGMLFTAKRLVVADRKQPVSFFDYSGPFFLIWFFPIGVWFIQPKVNRLLGDGLSTSRV